MNPDLYHALLCLAMRLPPILQK